MGKLIINADDFGISEEINKAIVQAFKDDLISSSTIMSNMPGFEDACKLIKEYNLHNKIGIHLNLIEGYPITKKIASCSKFCDESGKFKGVRRTFFWLNSEEHEAVKEELKAQVDKLLSRNIFPTHIDSHHHYHTVFPIGKEVIKVASTYGIKGIRLSRNCGVGIRIDKLIYKVFFNLLLRIHKLAKTKYFGSAADVKNINRPTLYDVEIMVHPGFDSQGNLIDLTNGKSLHPLINDIKELFVGMDLSSYYEIITK